MSQNVPSDCQRAPPTPLPTIPPQQPPYMTIHLPLTAGAHDGTCPMTTPPRPRGASAPRTARSSTSTSRPGARRGRCSVARASTRAHRRMAPGPPARAGVSHSPGVRGHGLRGEGRRRLCMTVLVPDRRTRCPAWSPCRSSLHVWTGPLARACRVEGIGEPRPRSTGSEGIGCVTRLHQDHRRSQ